MPESDALAQQFLRVAEAWYESQRAKNGSMNTNVMNVGLVVSRMLAEGLPIDDNRLYSNGRSQVRGLSGAVRPPAAGTHRSDSGVAQRRA